VSEPKLRLEPVEATRTNGTWRTWWRVTNEGGGEVRLLSIRAPHARFRAEPADLDVMVATAARVEMKVRVEAAPGEEIENAFVILIARREHETWRLMFRVRIRLDDRGSPWPIVEALTTHRVGFTEEV